MQQRVVVYQDVVGLQLAEIKVDHGQFDIIEIREEVELQGHCLML